MGCVLQSHSFDSVAQFEPHLQILHYKQAGRCRSIWLMSRQATRTKRTPNAVWWSSEDHSLQTKAAHAMCANAACNSWKQLSGINELCERRQTRISAGFILTHAAATDRSELVVVSEVCVCLHATWMSYVLPCAIFLWINCGYFYNNMLQNDF